VLPLDPAKTDGDAFDLKDFGVKKARYVRIHDLSTTGASNNADGTGTARDQCAHREHSGTDHDSTLQRECHKRDGA